MKKGDIITPDTYDSHLYGGRSPEQVATSEKTAFVAMGAFLICIAFAGLYRLADYLFAFPR